jgi:hypothetical protein
MRRLYVPHLTVLMVVMSVRTTVVSLELKDNISSVAFIFSRPGEITDEGCYL